MKKIWTIIIVIVLVAVAFGAGVLVSSPGGFLGGEDVPDEVKVPTWETGQNWVYAFTTSDVDHTIARVVVASVNDSQYQLGIDSRLDAQRHAVLNYNPMLGRITIDTLGVFEKGEPQSVLLFPLKVGRTWKYSLLDKETWSAKVTDIEEASFPGEGRTVLVTIKAEASSGERLEYVYDTGAEWFRTVVLTDPAGEEGLRMSLVSYDIGYSGDVYFIRGLDLYDRAFSSNVGSPEIELYDTFIDRGHPSWGPFDSLIYYYTIETGASARGVLTIRDHSTTTVVRKTFESNTKEGGLGAVASNAGEWGVTVVLQGKCDLHLRIAGGIEYMWTL